MKKLYLGCGLIKKEGWINVDIDPDVKPDIVSPAESLPTVETNTIDVIDSHHLFEHFIFPQAISALREWHRVLKPGGEVFMELPNYRRSVEMSLSPNREESELGFIGVYGYLPDICPTGDFDKMNVFQMHKHGWTPETLCDVLRKVGFSEAEEVPVTQTYRRAYQFRRDMRIRGKK